MGWMTRVQYPAGSGIFFLTILSREAVGPTMPTIQWILRALSPEIKHLRHEADHSHPSRAEIKNVWSFTSTPPYDFMAWCLVKHRRINLHDVELS
jgi:hypothetical protein